MKKRILLPLVFLAAAAAVWACTAPVSVTITPGTVTLGLNAIQQFTATVTGNPLSTTAVTWEVNSIVGGNSTIGTISSAGLYTAPASVPSPATVSVQAVSVADTTKSATASITISTTAAPSIASVSPAAGTTAGGSSVTVNGQNFRAGASITFAGASATSVVIVNSTQATAVTPAGAAGYATVALTNSDTTNASLSNGYLYQAASASSTFWGMDINTLSDAQNHWPSSPISFCVLRLWDSGVKWADIETSQGAYNWSTLDAWLNQAQAKSVCKVVYTFGKAPSWWGGSNPTPSATGTFATALAAHSAARKAAGKQGIDIYEEWNEPNNCPAGATISYYCGTVSNLAQMMQAIYNAVRANDATAQLATPSACYCTNQTNGQTSPWTYTGLYLSAAQSLGAGFPFADMVAYHNYLGSNPVPENIVSGINNMLSTMASYGVNAKPLVNTEWSWGQDSALSDWTLQAQFLARSELIAASKGVPFWWYGWDFCCWGTLWDASHGEHPAGHAYGELSSFWLNGSTVGPYSNSGTVWQVPITLSGGTHMLAVWNTAGSSQFNVPAAYQGQTYHDIYGNTGAVGATITIGKSPLLL